MQSPPVLARLIVWSAVGLWSAVVVLSGSAAERFRSYPEVPHAFNLSEQASRPLGIYRDASTNSTLIEVYEEGLGVFGATTWTLLRCAEMKSIRGPNAKNDHSGEIEIELQSGERHVLHVAGHTGRFRDVYEFLRFLQRVSAG